MLAGLREVYRGGVDSSGDLVEGPGSVRETHRTDERRLACVQRMDRKPMNTDIWGMSHKQITALNDQAKSVMLSAMECPHCHQEIDDQLVQSYVATKIGRIKSPRKGVRDKKRMSEIGKLGGWPKGKPRGPKKGKE